VRNQLNALSHTTGEVLTFNGPADPQPYMNINLRAAANRRGLGGHLHCESWFG
jgi:hypothetical protein